MKPPSISSDSRQTDREVSLTFSFYRNGAYLLFLPGYFIVCHITQRVKWHTYHLCQDRSYKVKWQTFYLADILGERRGCDQPNGGRRILFVSFSFRKTRNLKTDLQQRKFVSVITYHFLIWITDTKITWSEGSLDQGITFPFYKTGKLGG